MKRKKIINGILFLALTIAMVSTMGDSVMPAVAKPTGVTLYGITRHDGTIYTKYSKQFCDQHPEVDQILWLERTNVAAWKSAIVSGSQPVSVLWGGGPSIFNVLADEGLISPFENTTLIDYVEENIEPRLAGADMIKYNATTGEILWVAAAISSFGFTVNHDNLETYGLPIPKTWEDLASPVYYLGTTQHAIGMGDAPETTSNTRVYQIILQKFGWEAGWDILTRMAGNSKIFEGGSGPTRDSVITGSQAIAMTIDFYGYQAQAQESACEYIIPENESIVNADPIAIASSTPHQEYAEDFTQFVLSKEGQALWLDTDINRLPIVYEAFEYSKNTLSNDRTDLAEAFNKTISEAAIPFNETRAQVIYDIVTFYFQGALTRSSTQLYSAWDKIVTAYEAEEISTAEYRSLSRTMSEPKITLEDAHRLQEEYAADPTMRDSLVTEYSTYAKSNYNKIGNKIDNEKLDVDKDGDHFDEFKVDFTSIDDGDIVNSGGIGDPIVEIQVDVPSYGDWNFLYGVSHVDFFIDGNFYGNDTSAPYSIAWDTNNFSTGGHTVKATAYEVSGRSTFTQLTANVRYEITFPSALINQPINEQEVTGVINILISAIETSEFTISSIEISITDSEGAVSFTKTINTGFESINVTWDTLKQGKGDGTYTISVSINYETGNSQTLTIKVTVNNQGATWTPAPGFELIFTLLGLLIVVPIISNRRKK
ncbi:MAG: extracellular solute-binding protein [Candidatus Kariarchaeaceae archaeon]